MEATTFDRLVQFK